MSEYLNFPVDVLMETTSDDTTFTVIVAVWNGASTLQRCIDSVANQSYSNIELIIIDGDSDDGTKELLQGNEQNIAYWESKQDRGIYHAWNKALKHAQGEWIYFMGADDYFWNRSVIEEVHRFICESKDILPVVYGQVNVVDKENCVLGQYGEEWTVAKKSFYELMSLPHQGVFHQHVLFLKHGDFDEQYKIAADYEFLLRELIDGEAERVPGLIVAGMQEGGLSSDPYFALRTLTEIGDISKMHCVGGFRLRWRLAYFRAWIRSIINTFFGEKAAELITDCYKKIRKS